jgi:circadian clock protein KaiC
VNTTSRAYSSASAHAIDTIGAKRVVLDTIEALFAGLSNQAILRAEIRRLFTWLRDRGITTVITGERGDGALTRQGPRGVCLRLRDPSRPSRDRPDLHAPPAHRQVSRHTHGTNEYPFLIDADGISVLPITASGMDYSSIRRADHTEGHSELDECSPAAATTAAAPSS